MIEDLHIGREEVAGAFMIMKRRMDDQVQLTIGISDQLVQIFDLEITMIMVLDQQGQLFDPQEGLVQLTNLEVVVTVISDQVVPICITKKT
jgi:hypothetical protein